MSNPRRHPGHFAPHHLGEQPRAAHSNKGKKMANKTDEEPNYIPPKGK
ncbi:small acid-soluble spore protein N (minor) [Scopulibacillus daqui]|uniref:Small acid-soluble spore protein N (Minor) n=1 Tax=Scopulibacillus daqui TaxID=1469162 RepID=A0ABS2PZU4_9BACL|nr:acid-soluble spore protein N [Scopulibacillus daqui]MBM7645458.1 small acid-soluble spore protein N (minor) [Scopulibacillus daqui]